MFNYSNKKESPIRFLECSLFNPWKPLMLAGFTLGKLENSFGSNNHWNMALHTGKDKKAVVRNRKQLCSLLNIPFSQYTCADQTHSANVRFVKAADAGKGRFYTKDALADSDALLTNTPNVLLNIFTADCVPLILYDPITHSGGVCHAGWKGTAMRIVQNTILRMKALFNSQISDIHIAIGPAIRDCCYSVGKEVVSFLQNTFSYQNVFKQTLDEGVFVNLQTANMEQLLSLGVPNNHIYTIEHCTCCGPSQNTFSYRREGLAAGRNSAFFLLLNRKTCHKGNSLT